MFWAVFKVRSPAMFDLEKGGYKNKNSSINAAGKKLNGIQTEM